MRKLCLVLVATLGLAGCFQDGTEAVEKAKALYEAVKQSCGIGLQIADLVDVVTSDKYAGVTNTTRFICEQIATDEVTVYGLFSEEDEVKQCVAVVNDICVREED